MKNKNIKGFTLIELLIVISILAILMAGAYLALNPAEKQREANDARKISEFKQIQRALELYFLDHGYYPKFHFLHLKSSDATKEGFSNRLKPYINFNLNDSF
jgi:prepilin-type N-terminal cleavage/methylation domain-containing protein